MSSETVLRTAVADFMLLFNGRKDAYGTGRGQWIKCEPTQDVYAAHLRGEGPGLGIAPLLDDGTVWFCAIDLDEPDFDAAREMQEFLAFGSTWVERSRSGNAHVWAFFEEPIEAWLARGIMREATAAIGRPAVEVFPKQDKLREGMVGNYINLPYHGEDRPILRDPGDFEPFEDSWHPDVQRARERGAHEWPVDEFIEAALAERNTPDAWQKRARWLMIEPPEQRLKARQDFGTGKELHMCAEWIIANRDEQPILEGHRNVVYFNLAKMLRHYEGFSDDDAFAMLQLVRDSADEQGVGHVPDHELRRLFSNAGGFTSTGCDDPLMGPYVHPDCHIAHGGRR